MVTATRAILVRFKLDGTPASEACRPKTYTTTYSLMRPVLCPEAA